MEIASQASSARVGRVLAVLCGAPFLANLDLFVVNVALAEIGAAFPDHSLADLSWVLSAYAIVYAALLIPLGRWADRIGHKQVFLVGLVLFTLASAVMAVSPSLWTLVAFRMVQAFGAAALTPTSLGLLLHCVTPERRAFSVGVWSATGAVAAALGPAAGGLLVEASWRCIFLINVPFGILLILQALRAVPGHRPGDESRPNIAGAVLLTLGVGGLTMGIVEGPDWGWSSTGIVASFLVAALALAGFVMNNLRHRSPLIAPALLRVRAFAWSNATALTFGVSFAAGLLAVVLWLQIVWGYSAIATGFAVAPGPLMVPLVAIGGQIVTKRIPAGVIAMAGSLLWALGAALILSSVGPEPDYAGAILPGWLVCGVGVGLALPTILSSATAQLPPAQSATGSAIVNMTRQLGMVLGISALVAILGDPIGYAATHAAFQGGWWAVIATGVLSAATSLRMTPSRPVPAGVRATGFTRSQ